MTNKGQSHTPATRRKMSLKHRKHTNAEQILLARQYISAYKSNPTKCPNLASLALALNLTITNLLEAVAYNPDLEHYIEQVKTLQHAYLIENGLEGKTQPAITALLLKSKHGYNEPPTNLTQNNNFNLSPDILKQALELMKAKRTSELPE